MTIYKHACRQQFLPLRCLCSERTVEWKFTQSLIIPLFHLFLVVGPRTLWVPTRQDPNKTRRPWWWVTRSNTWGFSAGDWCLWCHKDKTAMVSTCAIPVVAPCCTRTVPVTISINGGSDWTLGSPGAEVVVWACIVSFDCWGRLASRNKNVTDSKIPESFALFYIFLHRHETMHKAERMSPKHHA